MSERWPAALNLSEAAEYCGLSVVTFLRVCPMKPMPLADGRWLRARLDEWKSSLPDGWSAETDKNDFRQTVHRDGWVYVVGFANYVKIGFTTKAVEERIASLQTGCPETLAVYAAFRGSKAIEASLHRSFADFSTQGEWFRREGNLAAWIEGGCK